MIEALNDYFSGLIGLDDAVHIIVDNFHKTMEAVCDYCTKCEFFSDEDVSCNRDGGVCSYIGGFDNEN